MIVRTHMTLHPLTLRPDSDCRAALRVMQDHTIHHLPVVGPDNNVLGIVAERDLLLAALQYAGASVEIGDIMHRQVVCVRDDAPITHAATLMAKNSIGGLPVVDARDRVIGIITETDLFRAFVGVLEAKTARSVESIATAKQCALDDETAIAVAAGRSANGKRAARVVPRVAQKAASTKTRSKAARRT